MLLIGINNGTDQGVTHDIPIGKITHGDAGHGLKGLQGLDQAGAFICRKKSRLICVRSMMLCTT